MKNHKKNKTLLSHGIMLGYLCAIIMTATASALGTYLIMGETIGEGSIAIVANGITLLAASAGGLISAITSKGSVLIAALITAGIYGFTLLTMGMFMDGALDGVLIRIGSVLIGSMVSCVFCHKKQGKKLRTKRHSR